MTRRTPAVGNTKNVGIAVSLKHLRNLCRTLEMSLVYCEINLMLTFQKVVSFLLQLEQNAKF